MAIYRVERTKNYTVMSNYHLQDKNLTLKAKGLLSMMLSFREDWNYTTRGLAAVCKEGVSAIGTALKELENAGYMVRRQIRDSNGRIVDTEYTIYERPQNPDSPKGIRETPPDNSPSESDAGAEDDAQEAEEALDPDMVMPESTAQPPETETPDTDLPRTENPYMVNPDMVPSYPENRAEINIDISSTNRSSTNQSILPRTREARAAQTEGLTERERIKQIHEQISYDKIVTSSNRSRLDELVKIMLDVSMNRSPSIKIGRNQEYATSYVQSRFATINAAHIQQVLDGIAANKMHVVNTKAYLLASLFNAPTTTDNHHAMRTDHGSHNSDLSSLREFIGDSAECW